MSHYLPKKARSLFKPCVARDRKRDLHACHNASHRLSAAIRRWRRKQVTP